MYGLGTLSRPHFLPLYTTWIECIECDIRVILDLIRLYFSTAHTKI